MNSDIFCKIKKEQVISSNYFLDQQTHLFALIVLLFQSVLHIVVHHVLTLQPLHHHPPGLVVDGDNLLVLAMPVHHQPPLEVAQTCQILRDQALHHSK